MATIEHSPLDNPSATRSFEVSASEALELAHKGIIVYQHALDQRGGSKVIYPVAGEVTLATGADPYAFSTDVISEAKAYGTKTRVVDVGNVISSDDALRAVQRSLHHFGRSYNNGLVLMLEGLELDEELMSRREGLRSTVAELVIPSLVIYSAKF